MGSDRESETEMVSKRSRQKGSWTDTGREAGGSCELPRDDLLRTACTTLVVTPLHLGILSPPLSVSPFRLFCRSPGTLAPLCLGGCGKPDLLVRIYSRPYPIRWNTRPDVFELESVQVDSRFHNRLFEIGRPIMGQLFRAHLMGD